MSHIKLKGFFQIIGTYVFSKLHVFNNSSHKINLMYLTHAFTCIYATTSDEDCKEEG